MHTMLHLIHQSTPEHTTHTTHTTVHLTHHSTPWHTMPHHGTPHTPWYTSHIMAYHSTQQHTMTHHGTLWHTTYTMWCRTPHLGVHFTQISLQSHVTTHLSQSEGSILSNHSDLVRNHEILPKIFPPFKEQSCYNSSAKNEGFVMRYK